MSVLDALRDVIFLIEFSTLGRRMDRLVDCYRRSWRTELRGQYRWCSDRCKRNKWDSFGNVYSAASFISNSNFFCFLGKTEIYKQPIFYIIGHFSRFIVENSIRIDVRSSNDSLETVGYKRPDESIAIVIFNK